MASPCCCVVRMHQFSTKTPLDRQNDPESLRNMPNIAPGTQFFGEFLRQIYPPCLLVTTEKCEQTNKICLETNSSFSIPISQSRVNSYAFDRCGNQMRKPPLVRPAPLQNNFFIYNNVYYRLENPGKMDHKIENDKN